MKRGWSDDGSSGSSSSSEWDAGSVDAAPVTPHFAAAVDADMLDADGAMATGVAPPPAGPGPYSSSSSLQLDAGFQQQQQQQQQQGRGKRACRGAGVGLTASDAEVAAFLGALSRADLAAGGAGAAVPPQAWRALCELNACMAGAKASEIGGR